MIYAYSNPKELLLLPQLGIKAREGPRNRESWQRNETTHYAKDKQKIELHVGDGEYFYWKHGGSPLSLRKYLSTDKILLNIK